MVQHASADERQFWIEVFDGTGTRTGIVKTAKSASVRRVLDGVGAITLEVPGTDAEANELLVNDAKVRFYIFERNEKRLIGSGVVRKRRASDRSNSFNLICSGPDELDDLRRKSTLLALEFRDETIENILNGTGLITGLMDYLDGWTADVDLSVFFEDSHYARFDGVSILKAVQKLTEERGIHFRLGDDPQTLEVGNFANHSGITLIQMPEYSPELDENDRVGIIESIIIDEDGEDTVNFIIPLGATTGADMALTLEHVTRTSPYLLQSSVWNGQTYHYIGNGVADLEDIMADNSLTVKVLVFDQIQIQSNSDADIESAANALYDAAVAYLQRHIEPHKQYSVEASKLRSNLKPGDKVLVHYKGWIEDSNGNLLPPVNINNDFWILDVTEKVTLDGIKTSLKLSNIDRHKMDNARVIVGELENIRIRNLSVKPYTTAPAYVYARELDPTHDAVVPIRITDRTLRVRQVTLHVKSTPFRSTAIGGAAGGDHDHVMFEYVSASADLPANETYLAGAGGILNLAIAGTPPTTIVTRGSSGTHTHPQDYGIYDDSVYPGDITVAVNGVDRTVALGGDWGSSGSGVEFDIDITEYILAEGTLRQVHEVTFGCGSGQGRIEVSLEIYQDVQNVRVN